MQLSHLQLLQALVQVIAPTAMVTQCSDFFDVKVEGVTLGSLSFDAMDEWYAMTYEPRLSTKGAEPYSHMDKHGPFATASRAVRRLFRVDNEPTVEVKTGISAGSQESSFMNATLQHGNEKVSFSVATYLDIPAFVQSKGEQAVAGHIQDMLSRASTGVPGLTFDVQVGPTEDPDE